MAKSHIFAVIGPTMIVSLPGFGVASMIGGLAISRCRIPPGEQGLGCPANEPWRTAGLMSALNWWCHFPKSASAMVVDT